MAGTKLFGKVPVTAPWLKCRIGLEFSDTLKKTVERETLGRKEKFPLSPFNPHLSACKPEISIQSILPQRNFTVPYPSRQIVAEYGVDLCIWKTVG